MVSYFKDINSIIAEIETYGNAPGFDTGVKPSIYKDTVTLSKVPRITNQSISQELTTIDNEIKKLIDNYKKICASDPVKCQKKIRASNELLSDLRVAKTKVSGGKKRTLKGLSKRNNRKRNNTKHNRRR